MDDDDARKLLRAERTRVQQLLDATVTAGRDDRSAANEPGDMTDSAEPLTTEETDDAVAAAAAARAAPDWDLVLKRNNVERLKREKFPLEIVDELEELGERNYLDISEEDMVRFQWYGLYQDKPKVGYFMLRIKAPSGIMTAVQYRALGELSLKFGRDYTELSTRQNVQLHWLQISQFPEVFAALDAVGLTSLGGCGDSVRSSLFFNFGQL